MTQVALSAQLQAVLQLDPRAPAVELDGVWTSWGQLHDEARAIDSALTAAGIGAGARVGLVLRNHPASISALLSVLASERCVVVLSPHYGDARLAEDVRALAPAAVIALPEDWQRAGFGQASVEAGALGLELGRGSLVRRTTRAARAHETLPGVAVLMLTSGTTGTPKRVPLYMNALERSLLGAKHYERARVAELRLRQGVAVISAPLVHVSGIFRVLQCVCDGRSFALMERFRVEPWLALIERHKPQTVSLVPTALRMVLAADIPPSALRSLKSIICGTAALEPEAAEAFEHKYGVPVLTTYGATEFAGGVAGWNLRDHAEWSSVGSSRVDLQACKLEYSIVSPK